MNELDTASVVESSTATFPLADHPFLQQLQTTLRQKMTRQWPTRYLPLCPPACATLVNTTDLQVDNLAPLEVPRTLVVFLPDDLEPRVEDMAYAASELCVHPDISLLRNNAYLSWSISAPRGQLPKSLWVKVEDVLASVKENKAAMGSPVLPIVFVAGRTVVASGLLLDDETVAEWETSLRTCADAPGGYSDADLARARAKAEKYGDHPWLFMRYELKVGNRRCAVNWAPVE